MWQDGNPATSSLDPARPKAGQHMPAESCFLSTVTFLKASGSRLNIYCYMVAMELTGLFFITSIYK